MDEKRIKDDFLRFIRHEAMQMNTTQGQVINIIKKTKI